MSARPKPKRRSTILSPELLGPARAKSLAFALLSVLAVSAVTCARASAPRVAKAEATPAPPRPHPPTPSPVASTAAPKAATAAPPVTRTKRGPVDGFTAALAALEDGSRKESVRVLWLGDSHTAADYYPNALRSRLQKQYSDGGPGFIYAGFKVYRHAGVNYVREGRWSTEPSAPATRSRTDDGVFGIGGVRAVAKDGTSRIRLSLSVGEQTDRVRWEVVYRRPTPEAHFTVHWGGDSKTLEGPSAGVGLERFAFEAPARAEIALGEAFGEPRIFGLIAERSEPGVVVDTLGINGARIDTPLAWDEAAWVDEVRRRSPSLVVIAYGSNEVLERTAPWRYAESYTKLLMRVRAAVPSIDCAILGVPDQAQPDWTTPSRVREIEATQRQVATEQGCVFVSTFEAMGGEGSFKKWLEHDPPFASSDRIHLTPKGYAELGDKVSTALLGSPKP